MKTQYLGYEYPYEAEKVLLLMRINTASISREESFYWRKWLAGVFLVTPYPSDKFN